MPGTVTSTVEVTNVSQHGIWLLVDGRRLFLSFDKFPWFQNAPIEAILAVHRPQPNHLRWPALDVDLTLSSIEHPEDFPLVATNGR